MHVHRAGANDVPLHQNMLVLNCPAFLTQALVCTTDDAQAADSNASKDATGTSAEKCGVGLQVNISGEALKQWLAAG